MELLRRVRASLPTITWDPKCAGFVTDCFLTTIWTMTMCMISFRMGEIRRFVADNPGKTVQVSFFGNPLTIGGVVTVMYAMWSGWMVYGLVRFFHAHRSQWSEAARAEAEREAEIAKASLEAPPCGYEKL